MKLSMGSLRKSRSTPAERRSHGLLRVPFVRRCVLDFSGGGSIQAFLVNINVLGAYVARDELPSLGQSVLCRFQVPGTMREMTLAGVVAWVNPRQQHPVHSLPPGFGLKFHGMSADDQRRIEQLIEDYVADHPQAR
jgi:Tfp pilus assembly protein PilZ